MNKVDIYGLSADWMTGENLPGGETELTFVQVDPSESHPPNSAQTGGLTGQPGSATQKPDPCKTSFCIKVEVWEKTWSDAARTYWQHFLDRTSPEAFGRMGERYARFHMKWDRFWEKIDCGGSNGPCGVAGSLRSIVPGLYQPTHIRVGRWMSPEELKNMQGSGRVVESTSGQGVTSVTVPPNAEAYKNAPAGDVFVEFDVPRGSVATIPGSGWGKIYGPSSVPFGEYYQIEEMPEAINIEVLEIP